VKLTMKTADASAAELKTGARRLAEDGRYRHEGRSISTKLLINKASNGEGTFGTLISDKQMAADLKGA